MKKTSKKSPAKSKPAPKPQRPAMPKLRERDDCPRGQCCLWRLGLLDRGKLRYELGPSYPCPMGETRSGSGYLELRLESTGRPCDEPHNLIPKGSRLNAAIHPIRRDDDLAFICGTFIIYGPDEKPLFEGDIDLMHRVNTHYPPFGPAPCDTKHHLQGWLTGQGSENGPARGFLLRAMLVARTDPFEGGVGGYDLGETHLNGVVIRCTPRR